jgi:hypothetical protein
MKSSLKVLALVLMAGSFAFTGAAKADDGEGADAAIGIIGSVIGSAIEAEANKEAAYEQDRRCRRFSRKCGDGEGWACEKFENECND